jgi:hypothetical protein
MVHGIQVIQNHERDGATIGCGFSMILLFSRRTQFWQPEAQLRLGCSCPHIDKIFVNKVNLFSKSWWAQQLTNL